MFSDFTYIFGWWALLFGIGVVFFPLSWLLLRKFFDQGYVFGKILGILIISYVVWLLGSLRIAAFTATTIWLVLAAAVIFNYFLFKKNKEVLKKEIKHNRRLFIFEEIIFFLSLAFWAYIRGFQPDINGLEKFMDFGFVNAILRSNYFPPLDMWLAGETINYYYFGHLVSAILTRMSGIDSAITYNLLIATLFAFSFTGAFSLGGNLIVETSRQKSAKKIRRFALGGFLAAFLLSLGSNLHPLWWYLKNGSFTNYWYPDATRFIVELFGAADNTIHEFPIYSFVVADLHGHLINLPFVLLALALILAVFKAKKIAPVYYVFISLLIGVFYMGNAWDFPIYLLILGLMILWQNYLRYGRSLKTLTQTIFSFLVFLFLAIIFSLPFHLHFKSITSGIAFVDFHSAAWMLLVLWGFPLLFTICFLSYIIFQKLAGKLKLTTQDRFVSILIIVSWILIVIPEIIYVKDIYIHSYQRANTMFKLTYQSFVMFSLVASFVIIRISASLKEVFKILFIALFAPFLTFILIYPYFAIRSYYGLKDYQGLYGLSYLERSYPDDCRAILWLRNNLAGSPVILEAVGESYTDFARVSANTGLPTVLGWRVHEWLWRGSFDEAGKRTGEVQEIYEDKDLAKTKSLLNKYAVKYIFLGDLERRQYPNLQEDKFNELAQVVFASGETKIYKLNTAN